MSRVGTTGLRGRLALDTNNLKGYPHPMNDPEVTMSRFPLATIAASCRCSLIAVADADSCLCWLPVTLILLSGLMQVI